MHLLGAPVLLKGRSSSWLCLDVGAAACCSAACRGGSQPFAELCTSEVAHAAMQQRSLELDSTPAVDVLCYGLRLHPVEAGKRYSRSNPLLFPLSNPLPSWSCMQEQMKTGSGPVSPETSTDGTSSQKPLTSDGSESLLARLQQAWLGFPFATCCCLRGFVCWGELFSPEGRAESCGEGSTN